MVDCDPLLLDWICSLAGEFWFCVDCEDEGAVGGQWAMQPAFDTVLAKSQFA